MESAPHRLWIAGALRVVLPAALALVLAPAFAGCADYRFQAGLANVPGINRPWTSEDFGHDVIANGDQSCPPLGSGEQDQLFHRWPPCGGTTRPRWRKPPPVPSDDWFKPLPPPQAYDLAPDVTPQGAP